jgi:hypothetical protein
MFSLEWSYSTTRQSFAQVSLTSPPFLFFYSILYSCISLSFQKRYFDGVNKVYPHLTAVVDVKDGVVQGIAWDDACIFCAKNECEANTFDFAGFKGSESDFEQPVGSCPLGEFLA